MTLIEILLTISIQVLFCLGIRTLLSEGMIFHFIRKPFENLKWTPRFNFILKPIILCVICFSSFWGSIVFVFLNGFKLELIICCISSAFLLKFINDKVDF